MLKEEIAYRTDGGNDNIPFAFSSPEPKDGFEFRQDSITDSELAALERVKNQ